MTIIADAINYGTKSIATMAGDPQPVDAMLMHFVSTLDVRLRWVLPTLQNDAVKSEIAEEIRQGLAYFDQRSASAPSPPVHDAWTKAYRLERLLALIEPKENLVSELKRRIAEAKEQQLLAAPRLSAAVDANLPLAVDTQGTTLSLKPGGENLLRSFLLDVLEELHWNSQRKFNSRPIQKVAIYRIVTAEIGALLLFVAPYAYIYIRFMYGHDPYLMKWAGLPLWTAMTAGLFGAFFSRLLFLQQNSSTMTLGAIHDAKEFTSIFLRGCVGMTGAVVVFFFLRSGAVSGSLFPKFELIGFDQWKIPASDAPADAQLPMRLFYPNTQLALLVVWCFLAGFSERFVPSILQSTETTLGKTEK